MKKNKTDRKVRINIRNVWSWFKDQMSHPSTLFQRISWGVFSEYAHYRRSDHTPKQMQKTKEMALSVSNEMSIKYGGRYTIYKCVYCDGWHVAKVGNDTKQKPQSKSVVTHVPTSKTLDVEKILATGIPDIHPVYGGVRGRTLASTKLLYAWPKVKEAGVHTVIDLREDGLHSKIVNLCEKYGIRYYYYKVDKKAELVESMIEHFDEFCKVIDEGNFYIACAEGLHRTDIALCTYWVFYAADRGVTPPEIWGYSQETGHNPGNIMRVLNAFYKRLTEINGKEPMPMDIFMERKQTIKQLSRVKNSNVTATDASIDTSGKKVVYISMDGVIVDYQSGLDKISDDQKKEYSGRFNDVPGIFSQMDPIPYAIDAIHKMQESGRFDMYVLTTAPWSNPSSWTDKMLWIQKYLDDVFHMRVIISHNKNLLKGDYLIDAKTKNGIRGFEGEWIQFGTPEFPDWESILQYLHV